MKSFRTFIEEKEAKPANFVNTIKKQMGVPKKLWLGMPILLSNVKLGKHTIGSPTMFYVSDFDKSSVTLVNVPDPSYEGDDLDGEIDLDKRTVRGDIEVTIDRDDFYDLQEPQITPGADTTGLGMGGL